MEETTTVLNLFDSKEKWSAYIELSNMREALVRELKTRLLKEIRLLADKNTANTGWIFEDYSHLLYIRPDSTSLIRIDIEWDMWKYAWYRRGVSVQLDCDNLKNYWTKVTDNIKALVRTLPLTDYHENYENEWLPFVKQIPAHVFDVTNDVTSVEECLYMAKDNAKQLATNIWDNVFQPFMNPEYSKLLSSVVQEQMQ